MGDRTDVRLRRRSWELEPKCGTPGTAGPVGPLRTAGLRGRTVQPDARRRDPPGCARRSLGGAAQAAARPPAAIGRLSRRNGRAARSDGAVIPGLPARSATGRRVRGATGPPPGDRWSSASSPPSSPPAQCGCREAGAGPGADPSPLPVPAVPRSRPPGSGWYSRGTPCGPSPVASTPTATSDRSSMPSTARSTASRSRSASSCSSPDRPPRECRATRCNAGPSRWCGGTVSACGARSARRWTTRSSTRG